MRNSIASLRRFGLYALIGGIGTACHYAILILLVGVAGVNPVAATASGATAGAIVNYLMNHRFTFSSHASHRRAAPRYALTAAIGILLNSLVMYILTHYWQINYLLSQCAATLLVLCATYLCNAAWTFHMPLAADHESH